MGLQFLGMGKTKFSSSICLIDGSDSNASVDLLLTERFNRKKNSGLWPEVILKKIFPKLNIDQLIMGENRDVNLPRVVEDAQNKIFPFYEYLNKEKLEIFASHFNPEIKFVGHHTAHAYAALALSPFEKSIILVMDGAGSELDGGGYEECTVFLQNGVKLTQAFTQSVEFKKSSKNPAIDIANRIGVSYEKASEFIFNSPSSSGKVMGLAPFGNASEIISHIEFQENLPWDKSFKGKTKKEWQDQDQSLFADIAATVQLKLENDYSKMIDLIKEKYPDYENLILTGGCALNCTNNAKIYYQNLFKKIFVTPFPGDESIGFGVAHYLKFQHDPQSWAPVSFEKQSAYFGALDSSDTEEQIRKEFSPEEFKVTEFSDIIEKTAKILSEKNIIAWFQGRSESGPRALGNRSILSRPDVDGLKDELNQKIKFRESFRPYGCSVLHDKSHFYFNVEEGFDNPYMSFAIKVRDEYKEKLKEVSHIDGTSRMQTVRVGQNEKFYRLIEAFGQQTGLYCLLNTSLNVMDEPILETISDARRFMGKSPIKYLVIENFLIEKRV